MKTEITIHQVNFFRALLRAAGTINRLPYSWGCHEHRMVLIPVTPFELLPLDSNGDLPFDEVPLDDMSGRIVELRILGKVENLPPDEQTHINNHITEWDEIRNDMLKDLCAPVTNEERDQLLTQAARVRIMGIVSQGTSLTELLSRLTSSTR